jgi:hypothetical protein
MLLRSVPVLPKHGGDSRVCHDCHFRRIAFSNNAFAKRVHPEYQPMSGSTSYPCAIVNSVRIAVVRTCWTERCSQAGAAGGGPAVSAGRRSCFETDAPNADLYMGHYNMMRADIKIASKRIRNPQL